MVFVCFEATLSLSCFVSQLYGKWSPKARLPPEMLGVQEQLWLVAKRSKSIVYAQAASLVEDEGRNATNQNPLARPA